MEPISAGLVGLAVKYLPDLVGIFTSKDDKAAKAASVFSKAVQDVTGASTLNEIDKALATQPELIVRLREAVMKDAHVAEEMRLKDVADARAMQQAALAQDDLFSKRFVLYYASAWTLFVFLYLLGVSFIGVPTESIRFVDTVLGFLLGTAMGAIIQFFFGSSQVSKSKDKALEELTKKKGL